MKEKVKTELFVANVLSLADNELYEKALSLVSDERKRKVEKLMFEKDRRLSVASEILLFSLLEKNAIAFDSYSYGEFGKPYLARQSTYFSISHSGDYALCAISSSEIGCDIEKEDKADEKIAERFFTKSEYEMIRNAKSDNEKKSLFYRYWTLKESFMKATGYGMNLMPDAFEIILEKEIKVIKDFSGDYHFKEFDAIPGYKCAICSKERIEDAEIKTVELEKILL